MAVLSSWAVCLPKDTKPKKDQKLCFLPTHFGWIQASFWQVSLGKPEWNQWVPAGLCLPCLPFCMKPTEPDPLREFYQADGPWEDCLTVCLWGGPQISRSFLCQGSLRVEQGKPYWWVLETHFGRGVWRANIGELLVLLLVSVLFFPRLDQTVSLGHPHKLGRRHPSNTPSSAACVP